MEVTLQIPFAQYGLGSETEKHHGNLAYAEQMAATARDTLNGIIQQITGSPVPSYVSNLTPVTEIYGYKGLSNGTTQTYVKINGGAEIDVDSADQAVDKGVLAALPMTKIIGGDLFLKRAIQNGQWGTITALLGDLQIAADYESYLRNEPVIDAAIASSYNSLSAVDQAFYAANQAFMTRAISGVPINGVAAQLPLTGNDVNFYNANKTQVDRILGSISVSTFAAGWITTLARAAELKLDQFGPSDFYGGMAGFLQSLGVKATGTAEHYEDFKPSLQIDGSLVLTAAGASSAGTFALLPQALEGPAGNEVANPHFQQGNAGWTFSSNAAQTDNGVDLTTGSAVTGDQNSWFGQGNDIIFAHMPGTPSPYAVDDVYSDFIASNANTVYEGSVHAAQHRGVAQLWVQFFDSNKNSLGYVQLGAGGMDYGGLNGDLNNFKFLQGYAQAPANTAYRRLMMRNYANGATDPYVFFTRPESHAVGVKTQAFSLAVVNASFESPTLAPGNYVDGTVANWALTGYGGVWNSNGVIAPTSGANVAYLVNANSMIAQDVGKMVSGTTYTFTADTGIRSDVSGNNKSGVVSLEIERSDAQGNVSDVAANSFTPTYGSLVTHSAFYTATAADQGQTLRVAVKVASSNTNIVTDNVVLTATTGLAQDLENPRFLQGEEDWQLGYAYATANTGVDRTGFVGNGNDVLYTHISGTSSNGLADVRSERLTAQAGQSYQYSVRAASQGGATSVIIEWFDATGAFLSGAYAPGVGKANGGQNGDPNNFTLIAGTISAPSGAAYRDIVLRTAASGSTDPYGYFTQPIFRMSNINGAAASWTSEPTSYTQGNLPDWGASGTSVRIANFGASIGYNTNGGFSHGNDLVDQHAALTAVNLSDSSSSNGEGGDDIILGGMANDTLNGVSGADWLDGGTGDDSLIGGDGNDVLLGQGGADTLEGDNGDDYLSGGDGIDTLSGNAGNDVLVGGAGRDTLSGGDGNDTLIIDQDGGALAENIDGGNGMDTASFERFTSGVSMSLLGQAGGDQIALLVAGVVLTGGQSLRSLNGQYHLDYQTDGNLVLYGPGQSSSTHTYVWASMTNGRSVGRVVLDGSGNLTVYDGSSAVAWTSSTGGLGGSYLMLDNAGLLAIQRDDGVGTWAVGGGGAIAASSRSVYGDNLMNIESLTGSNFNDVLTDSNAGGQMKGLSGDDVLNGGDGNDILEGGSGADQLIGAGGVNVASYAGSSAGVYVNLSTATAIGGDATGDTLGNIQGLTGSAYGDELAGSSAANVIQAGAGDDWIDGTQGSDSYNGGAGSDTLDYSQTNFQSTAPSNFALSVHVDTSAVYARNSDGSIVTQTIAGIEQFIGTRSNDEFFSSNTNVDTTFDGDGGNDNSYGGSGSDTYVVDRGYGNLAVSDSNVGANVISFKPGITFDDLFLYNLNGTLKVYVSGDSANVSVWSNFQSGNNVIKTIDLAGAAHVDVTDLDGGNTYSNNNDTIVGDPSLHNAFFGFAGDDSINANNNKVTTKGNIIVGGFGNDSITTSVGDDQFLYERGDGVDTVNDTGGRNTIVFGPTVAADDVIYQVVGNNLWVGLKDLSNSSLTASQVSDRIDILNGGIIRRDTSGSQPDTFSTMFSVEAGGVTTDLTKANIAYTVQSYTPPRNGGGGGNLPPIILDLNGDGLELSEVSASNIASEDAAGNLFRTAWVGPTNGILAVDRTGDGLLNQSTDISFIGDKAGATSDLEGLAGWDTNGDGILDAQDANFSKLVVWVDANVDGRAEAGEALSLAARGIASINLAGSPTGFNDSDTFDSVISNTTSFTRLDGTTGTAYDVSLARQLLDGQSAAAASPDIDLSAPVVIGEFTDFSVVAPSTSATSTVYGQGSDLDVAAQADFSAAGSTAIDATAAELWAEYLDPAEIAERKADDARGYVSTADPATIRDSTAVPDDVTALDGRGLTSKPDKLQAIVIDLSHDGPDLIAPASSLAAVDVAHTGFPAAIGWVAPTDAILAYDADGDGRVSASSEVSFVGAIPNARTGFQGLEAFDKNRDGQLAANDTPFAQFLLWRDANGDGISDAGETQTLEQAGITSVQLAGSIARPSLGGDVGNTVLGTTSVTFEDGSTKAAYDVALGYADAGTEVAPTASAAAPTAQPAQAANPVQITPTVSEAAASVKPVQPSSNDVTSGGLVGKVSGSAGALDGPDGEIVASTSPNGIELPWWRNASIVGTSLAALATPLSGATRSTGAGLNDGSASLDAADMQRQQLLRQSIAAIQAPAGGSAAIWAHAAANDGGLSVVSSITQPVVRPVLAAAIGG